MAIYVWEKVKDYLTKAGTTIFVASIAMWILLNFGPHGYTTEMVDSFGAVLGHWLVPFFEPIGLGYWQIAVALSQVFLQKKLWYPVVQFYLVFPILLQKLV